MKIYHNPRCRKSREGLAILQDSGQKFEIIEYLKQPLTETELKSILNMLGIKPIELIRKNEVDWKQNYKGKVLSDDELIKAMITFPKLMERPIVVKNNQAVLGRPPENIKELL